MKRGSCWPLSSLVLLCAVLLTAACVPAATPAAPPPQPLPTATVTAQLPEPAATVPADTSTAQPARVEPTPTAGPRPVAGRTHPPLVPGLTPAPLAGSSADIAAAIDEFLAKYDSILKLSGVFHVELDGQTMYDRAYGFADPEQAQPITAETRFRIGSVSKSMTATAILLLQQQGKLNVQDPVCKYIPACPAAWQPITIHQLLTHTSGIPSYTDAGDYSAWKKNAQTLDQMVERIKELPLSFEPGSQFLYSNSGFVLLSYIVERVSGVPFEQGMKQLVFDPLGMKDTGLTDPGPQLAPGYSLSAADRAAVTNHYGAGGFYSTAGDLSRWAHAWMEAKLLPADLRDLALADHVQWAADDWYGYGIGNNYAGGRLTYGHEGWVEGYLTTWLFSPEDQLVIVILVNNDRLDTETLLKGIEKRIFQQ